MRHSFFLFLAFATLQLSAQNACIGYFNNTKGAISEYNYYDGKGQLSLSYKNTVKEVLANGTGLTATIESIVNDKKGKQIALGSYNISCNNNETIMDIRGFGSPDLNNQRMDAEIIATGDGLIIPNNPQVGQKLNDAKMEMKVLMGKITIMNIKSSVRDFVIEAIETVTTPAGTFETIKATYLNDYKALIMGGTAKITIWMAKGVGVIKHEMYNNKNGKLEGKMELMSLKK